MVLYKNYPNDFLEKWQKVTFIFVCYNYATSFNYTFQKRQIASKKAVLARYKKYGNPGTPEGRLKGGLNSIKSQQISGLPSPFVARIIDYPEYSVDLAELIGILLGDGCINKNQIGISLNAKDDVEYAYYVEKLIKKLFNYTPSLITRNNNVILILISRVNIVNFLIKIGMKIGHKVRQQVDVPQWIKDNREYGKVCTRGLIDTDGCIYVDKHLINNRLYKNLGLNFSNRSIPLLDFVRSTWTAQGYHPTITNAYAIVMRREKEIIQYMIEVGSSNPKISNKFANFIKEKNGRVPKRL